MIEFTVYGEAAPQGSKARWGAEDNPRTKPWRDQVAQVAGEAMRATEHPLFDGPVVMELRFRYARPRSHFGSGRNADVLKPSAPYFKASAPDSDKLARACGDAMKGVCYRDDAQIAALYVEKVYSAPGKGSYAEIKLNAL